MDNKGKSELVIEHLGCGRFQVGLFVTMAFISYSPYTFSNQLMSFGNYNPGWRCLDNVTTQMDNMTRHTHNASDYKNRLETTHLETSSINDTLGLKANTTPLPYSRGDCPAFESCQNVEFDPEVSTIVTEWGLVCSKAWIPSLMISLQMVGLMGATFVTGPTLDAFGRKRVLYTAATFLLIFNIILVFSTSWQMFAALSFLKGIPMAFYYGSHQIYIAEFIPIKMRAIALSFPAYPVNAICFGIACLVFKDWRNVVITTIVLGVLSLIPGFWLPESMRWMQVNNKSDAFEKTAQRIAKWNRKELLPREMVCLEDQSEVKVKGMTTREVFRNVLKLFGKDYRKYTLLTTLPWLALSCLYYAISFGMKALGGNFFLNLIIIFGLEIVIDNCLMFMPNLIGRKKSGVVYGVFAGACLIIAASFLELLSGNVKTYGVAFLVMLARISVSALWGIMKILVLEIYPTVIRGAAYSYGLMVARLGGIVAPVLIPNDASTMFICYNVMGVMAIVVTGCIMLLPETRGMPLQDTFDDRRHVSNDHEKDARM